MSTNSSKSKSQSTRSNPSNYSQMYKSAAAGAAQKSGAPATAQPAAPKGKDAAATGKSVAPVRATSDTVDWAHEYAYVLGDLRRLGYVTAGLIVAIIVVGLFI
jgi:hypothetical protein